MGKPIHFLEKKKNSIKHHLLFVKLDDSYKSGTMMNFLKFIGFNDRIVS